MSGYVTIEGDRPGASATFSEDGLFRYALWRQWGIGHNAMFLMLNPSTADQNRNDPTVERCFRRAVNMGYAGMVVCNIFALRATDPAKLYTYEGDPVGDYNDMFILKSAQSASIVVCGWGNHGQHMQRGDAVLEMLESNDIKAHHLGLTKHGQPKHPLYISYKQKPMPYE